jgi:hypothetical protein
MDVRPNARSGLASERTTDMADMRRCIGSANFGIEAHEAPTDDFPVQPSQKDGLGRMCKTHWNQYTSALRKAALARKAAAGRAATDVAPTESEPATVPARKGVGGRRAREAWAAKPEPIRTRPTRGRKTADDPIVEAVDAAIVPPAANVEEASIA